MTDDTIVEFPRVHCKGVTVVGTTKDSRWLDEDGETLTGVDLELELLKCELESISHRILLISKSLR